MNNDEVKKIAKLANLELTEKEVTDFAPQLSEIISYVSKLDKVDTSRIEPMSHAGKSLNNIFQKGNLDSQHIKTSEALKNADRTREDHILTEAVL